MRRKTLKMPRTPWKSKLKTWNLNSFKTEGQLFLENKLPKPEIFNYLIIYVINHLWEKQRTQLHHWRNPKLRTRWCRTLAWCRRRLCEEGIWSRLGQQVKGSGRFRTRGRSSWIRSWRRCGCKTLRWKSSSEFLKSFRNLLPDQQPQKQRHLWRTHL